MKEITLGIEILGSYKSMNEEELDKQLLECVEKNEKKISLAKTAALAAYAHGKAGEAAEEKSSASYVTASEIIRGLQSI